MIGSTIFLLSILNAPLLATAVMETPSLTEETMIQTSSSSLNIAADEEPAGRFYFQRAYNLNLKQGYTDAFQQISSESYNQIEKAKIEIPKAIEVVKEQQAADAAVRAAKIQEYDDMFDKDARENDIYYGAQAAAKINTERPLLARESQSTIQKSFNIIDEIDYAAQVSQDTTARFQEEYDEISARTKAIFFDYTFENIDYTREQQRSAAALRNLKKASDESKLLTKRLIQEKSILGIRSEVRAQQIIVEEKSIQNEQEKQTALENIRTLKAQEREEFLLAQQRKFEKFEITKEEQEQTYFEQKFKVIDNYVARKKLLDQ